MTKTPVAAIILLLITAIPFAAQTSDAALSAELQRIARERILIFDEGDAGKWSKYVADEYIIATPSGGVRTKKQVMDGFRPPLAGYHDVFKFEDVHVTRNGDTAMMSYKINEHEFWDDQRYDIPDLRKTDTYVLRDGKWLIVGSAEVFVPAEPKATSVDVSILNSYVGRYRLMRSLAYDITRSGNKLIMQEVGQTDKRELLPEGRDTFFSRGDSGKIIFRTDGRGRVTALIIRDNSYDIRVNKIK